MSLDLRAQLLYIAPLLPAGVALAYIISVVFNWEQILARRKYGDKPHKSKDMKVSLPLDKTDIKLQEDSTWTSQIVNAAMPIAYHSFTSVKLWNMERSETDSINICVIQVAITMAEFAIDYFRCHEWHRSDLFALGASWGGMALRSLFPMLRSGLTGITSSVCIAMLGIFSVLPERPAANQKITEASNSRAEKSDEVASSATENTTPRSSNVHLHILSVSLLLVYLVRDYQAVAAKTLYRFSWMGSSPHLLITFGLLLLRDGVDSWRTTSRPGQTLAQHLEAFVSQVYTGTQGFDRSCVLVPLSLLGVWISLFFVSNYLTSCLGFRRLILGRPRTMPQFLDGGVFGGFAYLMVVSLQLFLRRNQFKGHKPGQKFRLVMAFVTACGQTVTGLVALAMGLYGLQMFGWMQKDSHSCCCSSI
ncbi:hypothetical protein M436DRAFT_53454 [Aureobasidium namibiae CBS 147.97]|uniref:Uncharacterized protein n=1 Tax=Aureobasidium namibiae CBS 147.97 TaxID=1043004 RepID=A0A074WBY5_9PEZI